MTPSLGLRFKTPSLCLRLLLLAALLGSHPCLLCGHPLEPASLRFDFESHDNSTQVLFQRGLAVGPRAPWPVQVSDDELQPAAREVLEHGPRWRPVDQFQRRLDHLRDKTTLFNDPASIYLDGVIRLSGSFKNGLLVNYETGDAPPTPHFQLMCLIPEQKDHEALEYGWTPVKKGKKKSDDGTPQPFVDYGGVKFREALERIRQSKDGQDVALPASTPFARSPVLPEVAKKLPGSKRASTDPHAERARKAAEGEAAEKKKRQRAILDATLAELQGKPSGTRRGARPGTPTSPKKR